MNYQREVRIKELHFPIDCYHYDAQIWSSVDGGKSWYHCGHGKYFRTLEEANAYKAEQEAR